MSYLCFSFANLKLFANFNCNNFSICHLILCFSFSTLFFLSIFGNMKFNRQITPNKRLVFFFAFLFTLKNDTSKLKKVQIKIRLLIRLFWFPLKRDLFLFCFLYFLILLTLTFALCTGVSFNFDFIVILLCVCGQDPPSLYPDEDICICIRLWTVFFIYTFWNSSFVLKVFPISFPHSLSSSTQFFSLI